MELHIRFNWVQCEQRGKQTTGKSSFPNYEQKSCKFDFILHGKGMTASFSVADNSQYSLTRKKLWLPGTVTSSCNPSSGEAEAERTLQVRSHPELHRKTVSKGGVGVQSEEKLSH